MSWGRGDEPNQHFLQYQLLHEPKGRSWGIGAQADTVRIGGNEITTKGGLLARAWTRDGGKPTWRFDLFAFRDTRNDKWGAKVNVRYFF